MTDPSTASESFCYQHCLHTLLLYLDVGDMTLVQRIVINCFAVYFCEHVEGISTISRTWPVHTRPTPAHVHSRYSLIQPIEKV